MVSGVNDVFLLREEVEFRVEVQKHRKTIFFIEDIDLLKSRLAENIYTEYKKVQTPMFRLTSDNGNNVSNESKLSGNFIDDYIVVCFTFGNDFMPHTPSIDLRNNGHEQVLKHILKPGID